MSELGAAIRAAAFLARRHPTRKGRAHRGARDRRSGAGRRIRRRNLAVAVPLVLVNGTAVVGQIGWASDHLGRPSWPLAATLAVAVLFAATVESIGLYLAYEAHAALLARDPALRLRMASYGVAAVVGVLNFSHYAPGWHPTTRAVTFGLLSTLSPWLWAIRSRSTHRDALREAELIDRRSARFALAKWLMFPARTWHAYRLAVDTGETRERLAWEAARPVPPAVRWAVYRLDPGGIPPADPVPLTGVPARPAEPRTTGGVGASRLSHRSRPTGIPPSRPATPVPPGPSRPPRPRSSRDGAGTAYTTTLDRLRRAYPSGLPSIRQVQHIDGRSRSRAGRIRKILASERS